MQQHHNKMLGQTQVFVLFSFLSEATDDSKLFFFMREIKDLQTIKKKNKRKKENERKGQEGASAEAWDDEQPFF